MRIGIDARFFGPDGTGIGRYVEKLLENLEELDKENEYFIFLRKSNFPLYNPKNKNFTKITVDAHWYSLKEQVIFPAALKKLKLDLVHFPHFNIPLLYSGKFVVTIHDLTKTKFGRDATANKSLHYYLPRQSVYKFTVSQAIARAESILVPSDYVKKEILKLTASNSKRIRVTYEAADDFIDETFSVSEGKVKELYSKFSIAEPFILYVGNNFTYKNIEVVIDALLKIDQSIKFVCISPHNKFLERLTSKALAIGVKDSLITPGFLPDEDLKTLFSRALCFVFPSLSEGFGLPGLEAMAVGCPVVAAKSSSLPEIYGQAALYFKPKSSQDLAEKINFLFKNTKQRAKMIADGKEQVKKYSWKKMAQETLAIYNEIYGSSK